MLKLIPLTALALGLSSGVALADHRGGEHRSESGDHRAAVVEHRAAPQVVRDHRDFRGGGGAVVRGGEFRGGGYVREGRGFHGGDRVIVNRGFVDRGFVNRGYYHGVERRPIFVGRPIIRAHYYNYYRQPSLLVENFAAMPGYYWVAGQWSWNGYEWLWAPGHYQPDPNYSDPGYADPGYDSGY